MARLPAVAAVVGGAARPAGREAQLLRGVGAREVAEHDLRAAQRQHARGRREVADAGRARPEAEEVPDGERRAARTAAGGGEAERMADLVGDDRVEVHEADGDAVRRVEVELPAVAEVRVEADLRVRAGGDVKAEGARLRSVDDDVRDVDGRAVVLGRDGARGQRVVERKLGGRRVRVANEPAADGSERLRDAEGGGIAGDARAGVVGAEEQRAVVNAERDGDGGRDDRLPAVGGGDEGVPGRWVRFELRRALEHDGQPRRGEQREPRRVLHGVVFENVVAVLGDFAPDRSAAVDDVCGAVRADALALGGRGDAADGLALLVLVEDEGVFEDAGQHGLAARLCADGADEGAGEGEDERPEAGGKAYLFTQNSYSWLRGAAR